jgi:hypothetical protein
MGFWQGLNEGYTYVMEEKARKKELMDAKQERMDERTAAKQERMDERSYNENQRKLEYNRNMTMATVPLLIEKRKQEEALAAVSAQQGRYFQERLSDLPPETGQAVTNIIMQDPSYGEALIGTVQKTEEELRRKLTGAEILKMTDIIKQTKPEDMSLEDWTKQAASLSKTSGSTFDFDATLENLLTGELDLADLTEMQVKLQTPSGTSLGLIPDFDSSVVMGADPQVTTQLRGVALDTMKNLYQQDLTKLDQEFARARESGETLTPDTLAKYAELQTISAEPDQDLKEARLFNFYAPAVIPRLAGQEPRFKTIFPEYFQTAPQSYTYDINGNLTQ